ncbi:MAG: methyltransferase domain-containing protein [Patescibacteria group bacterium]
MPDNNVKGGNELININVYEKIGLMLGMNVGDLGCGNLGYFSLPAAKIVGKSGTVYAVDILKSALQAVENRAKQEGIDNLKTVWSNLEVVGATKIPEASLDIAFIHNVLFQSDKDDLVIKEAYRLVKLGGKLMVIDWLKVKAPFGPLLGDRIDKEEVKKMAQATGFNFLEEFMAGPYHYGLIFVK